MNFIWNENLGKLILRFNLGFLMLFHGGETILRTNNILASTAPVPAFIIWPLALLGEVIAPLLIMAGVFSRIGALFVAGFMVSALLLRHKVLFLRNQDMTRSEHVAFARRFGRRGRLVQGRRRFGRLVGTAVLGIAGMEMQDRRPSLRRCDRFVGDLIRRNGQVGRHGGRMDRTRDRTGNDDFFGFTHGAVTPKST